MRTIQLTALVSSALIALALTGCAADDGSAPAAEPEVSVSPVTEEPANVWTAEEMAADLIQDFSESDTVALTALSERLDEAAPSTIGVAVRVSIFEEGEVTIQIIVADTDDAVPGAELSMILAELHRFTGSPVTVWTVEAKEAAAGTYVDLTDAAIEVGVPADMIGSWGDLTFTPEQLASFLG